VPTAPGKSSVRRLNGAIDPSKPLRVAQRELFAQMVASGVPVKDAYRRANYSGGDDARWDLRRSVDVDLRVNWLLQERIRRDTERRHRSEKKLDDIRMRVLRELERVAFTDVRDLTQWDRKSVIGDDGTVQGFRDELMPTPSHMLTAAQAAAIRCITTKGGALKIDVHDKLVALDKLARALGLFQDAAPAASSVTVNQVNVGESTALEAARRLAFALAKASQLDRPGQTLIGHAIQTEGKE